VTHNKALLLPFPTSVIRFQSILQLQLGKEGKAADPSATRRCVIYSLRPDIHLTRFSLS
jgi:hypothetical protein